MRITPAAKALDINQRTLKLWIENPALAPYFSEPARRDGPGRDLNDDDVIVANTIRALRAGVSNSSADWQGIADQLAGNHRDHNLPLSAQTVNTSLSVVAQQERMATVVEQRDQAMQRINELRVEAERLRSENADLQDARRADIERLMQQVAAEKERATRAEVELEMWRTGWRKPSK